MIAGIQSIANASTQSDQFGGSTADSDMGYQTYSDQMGILPTRP